MRKARPACLAGALCALLMLPSVAPAQDFPPASRFQRVTLNDRPGEPMSLPDGRVLHSARTGEIRIHNPRTGLNTLAADMRESPEGLYLHDEEGVQGIALDPKFRRNRWVYVYYSPRLDTPVDDPSTGGAVNEGDAPFNLETAEDRERLEQFEGYLLLSRFN
jgi:cytochrome c